MNKKVFKLMKHFIAFQKLQQMHLRVSIHELVGIKVSPVSKAIAEELVPRLLVLCGETCCSQFPGVHKNPAFPRQMSAKSPHPRKSEEPSHSIAHKHLKLHTNT